MSPAVCMHIYPASLTTADFPLAYVGVTCKYINMMMMMVVCVCVCVCLYMGFVHV